MCAPGHSFRACARIYGYIAHRAVRNENIYIYIYYIYNCRANGLRSGPTNVCGSFGVTNMAEQSTYKIVNLELPTVGTIYIYIVAPPCVWVYRCIYCMMSMCVFVCVGMCLQNEGV